MTCSSSRERFHDLDALLRAPEADLGEAPGGVRPVRAEPAGAGTRRAGRTALRRMEEILSAPSPYGLIKEAEGLISTVEAGQRLVSDARAANSGACQDRRTRSAASTKDVDAAGGDEALKSACLEAAGNSCASRSRRRRALPTSRRPEPRTGASRTQRCGEDRRIPCKKTSEAGQKAATSKDPMVEARDGDQAG